MLKLVNRFGTSVEVLDTETEISYEVYPHGDFYFVRVRFMGTLMQAYCMNWPGEFRHDDWKVVMAKRSSWELYSWEGYMKKGKEYSNWFLA